MLGMVLLKKIDDIDYTEEDKVCLSGKIDIKQLVSVDIYFQRMTLDSVVKKQGGIASLCGEGGI